MTYHRHFVFTNFTAFGVAQPTYINIMRDPVKREVSKLCVPLSSDTKPRLALASLASFRRYAVLSPFRLPRCTRM